MSHALPSLRVKALNHAKVATSQPPAVKPMAAPAEVADQRLAICAACESNAGGHCRLFGCCQKDLTQTVKLAFQQCPAGHWPRWVPKRLEL